MKPDIIFRLKTLSMVADYTGQPLASIIYIYIFYFEINFSFDITYLNTLEYIGTIEHQTYKSLASSTYLTQPKASKHSKLNNGCQCLSSFMASLA